MLIAHIFFDLIWSSIKESLDRFESVCDAVEKVDSGIKIRGYVSCVLGCPYEGLGNCDTRNNKVEYVIKRMLEMGCYEISLGDTIGIYFKKILTMILVNFSINEIKL